MNFRRSVFWILKLIFPCRVSHGIALAWACAMILATTSPAWGQVITNGYFMAWSVTSNPYPTPNGSSHSVRDQGNSFVSATAESNWTVPAPFDRPPYVPPYGPYKNATAFASATPFASNLLHAAASSRSDTYPGFGAGTSGSSIAGYRDFITYTGVGSPPPVLRFHAGMSGDLFTSPSSSTGVGILGYANSVFEFESANPGNSILIRQSTDGNYPPMTRIDYSPANWDTLSISPIQPGAYFVANHIDATWHIDVPYNPTTGGYRVAIMLQAASGDAYFTLSGPSFADFGHTLTLDSISLTDGTIIDPSNLTFESNLSFAAVPEPNSCFLVGAVVTCIIGGLQIKKYRRKKGLTVFAA
jgi:hypothetical protein